MAYLPPAPALPPPHRARANTVRAPRPAPDTRDPAVRICDEILALLDAALDFDPLHHPDSNPLPEPEFTFSDTVSE